MKERLFVLLFGILSFSSSVRAEVTTPSGATRHTPAPNIDRAVKQTKEGELSVETTGHYKMQLQVGKLDPPAAFNLEDIQNFPEDRLQPVLNNPLPFEEGRDYLSLMGVQDDALIHPWLSELPQAPFLQMKSPNEKSKEWTFSIIDQTGATVAKQEGKGTPPSQLAWNGNDSQRDHVAVDTVYIPQLATVDKEGYHHTFMGQPIQFSSILYRDQGKLVIELSSKRLFADNKTELTKEAPLLLDKVCDLIREGSHLPFTIQPYDTDGTLARSRQQILLQFFKTKLVIPENQILLALPQSAEKRGAAMTIISHPAGGDSAS